MILKFIIEGILITLGLICIIVVLPGLTYLVVRNIIDLIRKEYKHSLCENCRSKLPRWE